MRLGLEAFARRWHQSPWREWQELDIVAVVICLLAQAHFSQVCLSKIRSVELYSLVGGVQLRLEQLDGSESAGWNLGNGILGLNRHFYSVPVERGAER